jgi:hypothetical protein
MTLVFGSQISFILFYFELKKNTAFYAVLTLKRVCNKALAFWYTKASDIEIRPLSEIKNSPTYAIYNNSNIGFQLNFSIVKF